MFGFLNGKEIDEKDMVATNNSGSYPDWLSEIDPLEPFIAFDTLNAITKEYYSPRVRVKRMLQHAKVAAEKGSWWCNIPDVGEEEIALLKDLGFRIFRKYGQPSYQYSLNWSDKSVNPKDTSLEEL